MPPRDPPMPFREKLRESTKLIPCLLLIVAGVLLARARLGDRDRMRRLGRAAARCCSPGGAARSRARAFFESVMGATRVTCMIMLILAGAAYMTAAMAYTGIPAALADWVKGQDLTPGCSRSI